MKLIDADALKEKLLHGPMYTGDYVQKLIDAQHEIPRMTPEEERLIELGRAVRTAKVIEDDGTHSDRCSGCGVSIGICDKYCWTCGAKLIREEATNG